MIVCDRQDELGTWLAIRSGGSYVPGDGQYIGLERNGKIVAVAGFDRYNKASVCGHIAVDGSMMEKEWMRVCFDYVFNQLKVHKLIGIVASDNEKAIKLDKHFGYVQEAVLKGCSPNGADTILFSMTKEQCRILNKR